MRSSPLQDKEFLALRWEGGSLKILNQRLLPREEAYISADSPEVVARAICTMQVRGAPAIGVAAAFGLALAVKGASSRTEAESRFSAAKGLLWQTRPTARNLFWALERMADVVQQAAEDADLFTLLEKEALTIQEQDYEACRKIGEFGAALMPDSGTVLTHCNAGALATAGWGTALGVIRSAVATGKDIRVLADETRPLLQGSRLTAWELERDGIPVTVIPDSAAVHCITSGMVDAIVVGADRIARNGDVVNKIGTHMLALAAYHSGVPFYVAAPLSTLDLTIGEGRDIPIEERGMEEVLEFAGSPISAATRAFNPAFDMTPAALVTAIITERGVVTPPYENAWPT